MASSHPGIYVPLGVGPAAFEELDRVPWSQLAHAYGIGKLGANLYEDVAATLRQFGVPSPGGFEAGAEALFSNLCHQGTIYQATAFSVPFLAAFAAGVELSPIRVNYFVAIFASIGFAASFDAPGSHGAGIGALTRDAIRASVDLLAATARLNPGLNEVVEALAAMVRSEPPDPVAAERLDRIASEF